MILNLMSSDENGQNREICRILEMNFDMNFKFLVPD